MCIASQQKDSVHYSSSALQCDEISISEMLRGGWGREKCMSYHALTLKAATQREHITLVCISLTKVTWPRLPPWSRQGQSSLKRRSRLTQFTAIPTPLLLFLTLAKLMFCVPLVPQAYLYSSIISHCMPGAELTFSILSLLQSSQWLHGVSMVINPILQRKRWRG